MSNLTNFNNFELNTEETTNVEGGRCGSRRRRRSYSYNNCYSSYNNCYSSYNNCQPAVEEVAPVEETIIETVVEAPATPEINRGIVGA